MKFSTIFRTNYRPGLVLQIGFFLLLPLFSFTQTFVGESGNPADNGSLTAGTVTITPPGAMQAGDLVVIYAHYRHASSGTLTLTTTAGQTWTTEGASDGNTQRTRIFWCSYNGTWAGNPVVARGGGSGTQPLTAVMYVFRPTNPANSWGKHAGPNSANPTTATVNITGLTTTVPNTVTMAFWGSIDDNTWGPATGAGWNSTAAAQYRNTGGSQQSHTAAYNIQTTAATVADVSKTQTANGTDITRTSIISWYEIPPPSNDECSNAVNLAVNFACSNIPGTLLAAAPSAIPLGVGCPGSLVADVWYKFTAVNNTASVELSNLGSSISSNARIEVLTGNCGSFTSVACGTTPLSMAGTLTAGTTYYVRVYANSGSIPNANANFNICIRSSILPSVRFGNSYVNISKKTTGGVVEPGDTLEIRMTVQHSQTSTTMSNLRFVDNVPTNTTMLTGTNDSIRIITNEGLTYKKYTPAADGDAATYLAAPPAGQFNIRMNLSFGTSSPGTVPDNTATNITTTTGSMVSTNYPRGGGALLFATAYRVVASGGLGDTITLNPAQFIYRTGGSDVTLTATPYKILISDPLDLCANSIGINNAAELGGTFGSGPTLNRPTDLTNPIPGYSFLNNVSGSNGLGDGRYAIVNNISPRSGTIRTADRQPTCPTALPSEQACANRMHGGHWDIDGDHTGTNDAIGNIPPNGTTNSGYMLMVNADYVASEVFSQTLNNLCPNTYYEFSAWFRNICPTCGADSTNQQFAGTATAPANGYVGVYPNLSFALDGLDYYSTGEINVGGWLKKGFVFRTGASQTNAVFSIRNNSQGGGGNDWVMDDIAVATCLPTMSYSPTINPNVCEANPIIIADTISSFFNNYTTYKWQRSNNNGASWTDITGVTSLPDTNYYITTYTVPPSSTTLADSGNLYRVVVATTAANLVDPNCNISDGVTITLSVLDCTPVLDINLLSFNGQLIDSRSTLSWSTSQENSPITFIVERSTDGRNFSAAGEVPGYNNGKSINHYSLTDPVSVSDKVWYRIVMVTTNGKKKHSSIIQLRNDRLDFELSNIINPFSSSLSFNITAAASSVISIELIDIAGRTVLSGKQMVYTGTNSINLGNTQPLSSGIYTLRVINKDKFITRQVVKKN